MELKKILNEEEIQFIKNHLDKADEILISEDPNDLILELQDYTTFLLMNTDEVPYEVRFAERIVDKIVYEC